MGVDQVTFKIGENMGGKEVRYMLPTGTKDTLQFGKKFNKVLNKNIRLTVAVSKFINLYIGDIKFFEYLLSMVNSDTCWSLHCR
jgi:hypothetical protein